MTGEPPPRAPGTARRWEGSLAGIVSLALGLGVAQLVAGWWRDGDSPVISVGDWVIDNVPPTVKDWAIRTFGTNDKLALIVGTLALLTLVAAMLGRLARRHLGRALAGVAAIGIVGAAAALSGPNASAASILPSLVGSLAAGAALAWLSGWRPDTRREAQPEGATPTAWAAPAPSTMAVGPDRRTFLLSVSAIGAGAVIAGGVGQVLKRRYAVAGARRDLVLPPPVSVQGLPAGAELGVPGQPPFVTPNDDFYRIDTALLVPQVSPDRWRLRVHGLVERELQLTFDELLRRPLVERTVTLSCVSNEVGGPLVGNAVWKGALLADVLDEAGVDPRATQLLSTSADGWTCGTPVAALLDGRDALLAVGMNGEPLPIQHGFPVRMVVPGLYGYVSATKWVVDLKLTTWEDDVAYWVPRGWAREAPVKTMSRIDVPRHDSGLRPGPTAIAGVAWAPHRGISAVEVRVDDGPWEEARLGAVPSEDSWVQWVLEWDATEGDHVVTVRAVDGDGQLQPEQPAPPAPDGAQGWHRRHHRVRGS
ncbi:MAG TPA: molybdopterin-dependent oxidoreductase [Acidimicrobiales bacterium]|nr:molybdopterin-dependent oxidoreductase [Acidimicrobiales bacterium]